MSITYTRRWYQNTPFRASLSKPSVSIINVPVRYDRDMVKTLIEDQNEFIETNKFYLAYKHGSRRQDYVNWVANVDPEIFNSLVKKEILKLWRIHLYIIAKICFHFNILGRQ